MPPVTVTTNRLTPFPNYRFKVKWDSSPQYVAGLSKMGPLRRTTQVIQWHEAGENIVVQKFPGTSNCEAVTLEAGITYDTSFEDWANLVNDFASHSVGNLREFRKNVIVDIFNEAGLKVLSYVLYRAWASEYQALPELDAGANAVAITTLKLEFEWFERDRTVAEDPNQGPARSG